MKRLTCIMAVLLFCSGHAFSQATSENFAPLYDEMAPVLSQARQAGAHSLILKIKWHEDGFKKRFMKQTISYYFVNDSVIRERMDGVDYYGLLKNGVIYAYDTTLQRSVYSEPVVHSRDSANCRITAFYDPDTTYHYTCCCVDASGNHVDSSSVSKGKGYRRDFNAWRKSGDTLFETVRYSIGLSPQSETYKRTEIRQMCSDGKSYTLSYAAYYPKQSYNDYQGIKEVQYSYGLNGLITRIEKYESYKNDYVWDSKHIMSIIYK